MTKNVNYYNKKCLGCGSFFSNDRKSPSYVSNPNEKTKYCERCFKIINYGQINSIVTNDEINKTLDTIEIKNNVVALVVDLFDINGSIIDEYKNIDNLIILVNKITALPKSFNKDMTFTSIAKIFNQIGINKFKNILFYDSKSNVGINNIYYTLTKIFKHKKIYVIGRTNVGKSSLINSLLKFSKRNNKLTVSPFINTTISFNKVEIDKNLTLIDTPGYECLNVTRFISNEDIKKIYNSKLISRSFQIKKVDSMQTFLISDYMSITVMNNLENASITFYSFNDLSINRTKFENIESLIKTHNNIFPRTNKIINNEKEYILDEKKKNTIFLSGLGFAVVKKTTKILIKNIEDIEIFITENSII